MPRSAAQAAARSLGRWGYERAWELLQAQRLEDFRRAVARAVSEMPARAVVVFPPSVRWGGPLRQRPKALALALSRLGCLVFYCEPPHSSALGAGLRSVQAGLFLARVPRQAFSELASPIVFVLSYNGGYLSAFHEPRVVYEVIDHLGVFPNRRLVAREHPRLLRLAEVVVTTSEALWSEAARTRPDTLLSSNGVDYEEVRAAIRSPGRPPEDLQALVEAGKPLVGYYGALARWLDYDLLLQVALKRPDLEFLLIGPNFDGSLRALQTQPLANLHWIGPRPPDVLLGYLRYFDATMIPFRVDPLTDAASPLKLFEYMAAGKPVVATPTQELRRFAEVFTGRDPDGFSQAIDQALAARGDDGYLARLDRVAREHDWSQIARPILERLGIGREGKAEGR